MTAAQVTNTSHAPSTSKCNLMWDHLQTRYPPLSESNSAPSYFYSDIFPEVMMILVILHYSITMTLGLQPQHQSPLRIPQHQQLEAQQLIQRMLGYRMLHVFHGSIVHGPLLSSWSWLQRKMQMLFCPGHLQQCRLSSTQSKDQVL